MKKNKFEPVAVYDAFGLTRQLWLAVELKGEEVSMLISDTTRLDLFTKKVLIGHIAPPLHKTRLIISQEDPQKVALTMKAHALKWGATPEAIRLLGLMCPLTKEEEILMPKLARKDELKAAAKATPVAVKKPIAKRSNGADQLAEAASRKRDELLADKRKIIATDKGKAKLAKVEDDDKLAIMVAAKTVGAAIETDEVAFRDISYAEKVGLIDLV